MGYRWPAEIVKRTPCTDTLTHGPAVTLAVAVILTAAARGADITSPCNRSSTARPPKLAYQPLADYIAKSSRKSVEIKTAYDYADFWLAMKGGKPYNLVAWSA